MQFDPHSPSSPSASASTLAQRILPRKRSYTESQSASVQFSQSPSSQTKYFRTSRKNSHPKSTQSYSRQLHTAVQTTSVTPKSVFTHQFAMPSSKNTSPSRSRVPPSASGSWRQGIQHPSTGDVHNGPLQEPIRDLDYIQSTYNPRQKLNMKPQWSDNPKAPLSNYVSGRTGRQPVYSMTQGTVLGIMLYRCSVVADYERRIIGEGDAVVRKDAEQLAALSAMYQLMGSGLVPNQRKPKGATNAPAQPAFLKTVPGSSAPEPQSNNTRLSDGTEITYERARAFMDYYCRRYGFGKPDISFDMAPPKKRAGNRDWEAFMKVGGRRIGIGSAQTKKAAQVNCYLDVVQYLESCDPELWKTYLVAVKQGTDVGMGPKVFFSMSDNLDDEIRDLCADIRKSTLYKNRPAIGSGMTGSDPARDVSTPALPRVIPTSTARTEHSAQFFAAKSRQLLNRRKAYLDDPKHATMRAQRESLPVTAQAAKILVEIARNDVTIVMAATGSGKTTQIPQLLLDSAIESGKGAHCNIICTQPRRIAAISVAERVARERGEYVGTQGSIGYQVRFEAKLPSRHGSVTFCTTGIFLKRMQSALLGGMSTAENSLDDVTHVVVDEVHERDVDTDLLLVVLKRLLKERKAKNKPIKIILMSATIDPNLFQDYFKDEHGVRAPVIEAPGRSFPVVKHYLNEIVPPLSNANNGWVFREDSVIKYLNRELGSAQASAPAMAEKNDGVDDLDIPFPLVALTIAHVLKKSDSGHVLVFLPGWEEITSVQRILLDRFKFPLFDIDFSDSAKFAIHLLHSSIPVAEQQAIFEPPPPGVRRVILATNIAETSITIPDVVYVVDTGKIKENRYDPERRMSSLVSAWVGSSNLNQRAGRAGRHRPGEYYGILSERSVAALNPYQTVEMKRVDLSNVVMHVKALDFPGMEVEEVLAATIEPPAPERVAIAMNDLKMVGALDDQKNLTSLGRVLLQLPVEVQMGRLVLFGSFFRCLDQALTLAAILTNRDPFLSPPMLKKEASVVKSSWSPQEYRSDALAVLFAYNAWWEYQRRGEYQAANRFCGENFLSKPTLLMIQKIKGHLLQAVYHAGVIDVSAGGTLGMIPASRDHIPPQLNTNKDSLPLLAALIAIASQPKFAIRATGKSYRTARDKATFIHPSSVNHRKWESVDPESSLGERQIFTYSEKRQNATAGGSNPQMSLVGCTRLDPLSYILFGAYNIEVTERGLDCDGWLPIVGNLDALDDIQRLKTLMESCMLRVFEGVSRGRRLRGKPYQRVFQGRDNTDEESGDEDDPKFRDFTLSDIETKELDFLTRDIVSILEKYNEERLKSQSRRPSQPGTPLDSPALRPLRPPSLTVAGRFSRSGSSTPYNNISSSYPSRASTPGLLSEAIRKSLNP